MDERKALKLLENEIVDWFGERVYWYKIPDMPMAAHKRPFDVWCVFNGQPYAIEAKSFKQKLKPHQLDALAKVSRCNGVPVLLEFSDDYKLWRVAIVGPQKHISAFSQWFDRDDVMFFFHKIREMNRIFINNLFFIDE